MLGREEDTNLPDSSSGKAFELPELRGPNFHGFSSDNATVLFIRKKGSSKEAPQYLDEDSSCRIS